MLDEARARGRVDAARLAQLVIWATLESDMPQQQRYVEACQRLSTAGQRAVFTIAEHFRAEEAPEPGSGSVPLSPTAGHFGTEPPTFSPQPRVSGGLPDFMEVGLDTETRFRRLKAQYIAAKEEQERWDEERLALRSELEDERAKRPWVLPLVAD